MVIAGQSFDPFCEFTALIDPVGKGRPRFTRTGHTYTPKATATAEFAIRSHAWAAMRGRAPTSHPVRVEIVARMPIPRSWTDKKRREHFGKPADKKPDADNVAKLILDALNGLVFEDDKQVVSLTVEKIQWPYGSVSVRIFEQTEEQQK